MRASSHRIQPALGAGGGLALLLLAVACGQGAPNGSSRRLAIGSSTAALASEGVCSPTGAHPKHAFTSCKTCHACDGVVQFDSAGAAVAAGRPAPAFDAAAKTCSNVACHGLPAGTYNYSSWDWGLDEPVAATVSYGGTLRTTPSWNATGAAGCTACHDNPPRNATWHSGFHANQGATGAANQCQFCHPDATGSNGQGTGITSAVLHGNGKVDMQARYVSSCFGCH
jgi:predicted CxxxxCH...CXXCH cytochrome family protein